MSKLKYVAIGIMLAGLFLACSLTSLPTSKEEATATPVAIEATPLATTTEAPTEAATEAPESSEIQPNEPVQLTGSIEVSNALIMEVYFFERFAMLEDLTGFVQRDYEYEQPLEAQILGPVTASEEGAFSYTLNLPARPVSPLNDLDNDGQEDEGVQIWQVVMGANYFDDPFLGEDETGGWSANYTSARIDSENKDEIIGGILMVWVPDDEQEFPTSFGEDGLLFTEDDPVGALPAGYTLIDLDAEPFDFYKEATAAVPLYEGELTVNDLSEMSWTEAFEALHTKVSLEYPFTEMKDIDWDALYETFAPRVEESQQADDDEAYYLALRDYSWSIPDGHVGLSFGEIASEMFQEQTEGGYGFAIIGLDDGRVITHILLEEGPAAKAGMAWGAEILAWNGNPIVEALAEVEPWSKPFSREEVLRLQQYRYLLRDPVGTEAEVTFQNPDADEPTTATLTAVPEGKTFTQTSFFAGFDYNSLPVTYEILPSGYGYIKISSLSEDINLIIRLWEYALERMIENQVPGLIIDMRQNSGGSPLGTLFASYFVEERIDISRSYYYSEKSGEFETYGPPDYTEPDDELHYDGQLAVLVGPACASACEDVSYVLGQLEQTRVFGYYATNGIYGEVARGQYLLPGGYSFQTPTGMTKDMEGNIIIEGTGVVPDVDVPLTEETVQQEYVQGGDVVLEQAIETLSQPLGAGVTPEHSPTVGTKAEAESAFQAQTEWLEDFAQENYEDESLSQAGETYTFTVPLNTSRKVMWFYAWCTADQESFEDNWSKIELAFSLNGENVPLEDFAKLEGVFEDNHCRAYYTVLSDWAVGEHIVKTEITFTDSFNDGIAEEDFPAGTHVYEYHVYVGR